MALVLVARARPRLATGAAAIASVAVGIYGFGSGIYSMHKFSTLAGYPAIKWKQQAWVDENVHGEPVAILDYGASRGDALRPWRDEVSNFNTSIVGTADFDQLSYGCCGRLPQIYVLHENARTGRVGMTSVGVRSDALPRYLMSIPGYVPYGLDFRKITSSTYTPVEIDLVRRAGPLALTYTASGFTYDGYLQTGKSASVRVFRPQASSEGCLTATLQEPDGTQGVHYATVGRQHVRRTACFRRTWS